MRLLPHLLLLLDRAPRFDDADLLRIVRELDPDGDWRFDRMNGQAALIGRGTIVGALDLEVDRDAGDAAPVLERHRRRLDAQLVV